jgi:hypothetical protein
MPDAPPRLACRTVRRLWTYLKSNKPDMAKKQFEYTLQISPNYSHVGEIKKILPQW